MRASRALHRQQHPDLIRGGQLQAPSTWRAMDTSKPSYRLVLPLPSALTQCNPGSQHRQQSQGHNSAHNSPHNGAHMGGAAPSTCRRCCGCQHDGGDVCTDRVACGRTSDSEACSHAFRAMCGKANIFDLLLVS